MKLPLTGLGVGLMVLAGCTAPPTPPAPPAAPPSATQVAADRLLRLQNLVEDFLQTGRDLPGRSPQEQRQKMGRALGDLAEALPMLAGQSSSNELSLQFRMIESSRSQLSGTDQDWPSGPAINTALRAGQRAMEILAQNSGRSEALAERFQELGGRITQLDDVRGATHAAVVAQAVRAMGLILQELAVSGPVTSARP